MTRLHIANTVLATSILVGLSAPFAAADDATVPYKEHATGGLTNQVDPTPENPVGHQDFAVVGNGTHMGQYTQVGGHDFFADGTLVGVFTSTAADGSTISGTYSGTFQPVGGGVFRFDVIAEWLVGTGRLEGVTGIAEVTAFLDGSTGAVEYVTDGEWTLP